MSLFGNLFSAKRAESVVFIEIAADSIGGAYARFEEGKLPAMVYSKRVLLDIRANEPVEAGLARTLALLGDFLIREGAPALARATGSGSADTVIVSIASPWQEAAIRVEKFESPKPFTFTRALLKEALERSAAEPAGKVLADESVLATILNGYETNAPFGRRVSRASVMILASAVDAPVAETAASSVRALYHTHASKLTAYTRMAYAGVHALFPHEEEYLVIEVRGGTMSLLIIKRSCLVGTMTIAPGAADLLTGLKSALDALSMEHPLPHTLFLLASDNERDALKQLIEQAHFEMLWLVEGAPRVIPITPELCAPLIALAPGASRDLFLSLAILFYAHADAELR